MCCNRSLNNKINRLHQRCLRIVYNDKKLNFEDLLERDGPASIHHQNIRFLAIKMFKVSKGISHQIVKGVFQFRDALPHQLRKQTDFQIPFVHGVFSGTKSIKFLVPKIWEILPHEIKQLESLKEFKKAIKQWKPTSCPSRFCKTYIHRLAVLFDIQ